MPIAREMTPSRGGLLNRLVLAGAAGMAVAVIVVALLALASSERAAAGRRVGRDWRAASASELLERHVVDLETGLRGFVRTGDRLFLAPWTAARAAIPQDFAALRRLTAGQGAQQARLDGIRRAVSAYVGGYAAPALRRRRPVTGVQLDAFNRRGKVLVDSLRVRFDAFDRAEALLLQRAQSDWTAKRRVLDLILAGAAFVLLAGLLCLLVYVARVVVAPVRRAIAACVALGAGEHTFLVPEGAPSFGRCRMRSMRWASGSSSAKRRSARPRSDNGCCWQVCRGRWWLCTTVSCRACCWMARCSAKGDRGGGPDRPFAVRDDSDRAG